MFQFPPFASLHIAEIIVLQTIGLSHSEIPGSKVICPNPGLSQLITSFIASVSQGIRHSLFFTFANDRKQT